MKPTFAPLNQSFLLAGTKQEWSKLFKWDLAHSEERVWLVTYTRRVLDGMVLVPEIYSSLLTAMQEVHAIMPRYTHSWSRGNYNTTWGAPRVVLHLRINNAWHKAAVAAPVAHRLLIAGRYSTQP